MKIGAYIKQLRTENQMTQEQLGQLIGVKRSAVQKWECGTTQNLKVETIKKLSEIFGVSPASFVENNVENSNVVNEKDIKVALFGGDSDVTDQMWDEVKNFVEYVKLKEQNKNDRK